MNARGHWIVAAVASALLVTSACSPRPGTDGRAGAEPSADAPVVELLKDPAVVPAYSLTDITGRTITSEDLRGKVVFVNFWATWCPPCRAEIPDLIALQEKYRDQIVVLGISEDETGVDTVKGFVAQNKMTYPVAMSTPELTKVFRGVSALPTTFVIDRDGKLAQRHVGMLRADQTELEAQVLAGMNVNARIERVDDPAKVRLAKAAQATSIPGVDLSRLTPAQRTEAIQALNAENCTCGCGSTLAECRIDDPTCGVSLPLARALVEKLTAANAH